MKQIILLVICFFYTFKVFAQTNTELDKDKKVSRISTPKLTVNDDENTIVLEMGFNGSIPKNKLERIKVDQIATISLVYTKYKLSEDFNHLELNAQRLDKLYASIPALKDNKNIKWFWIEQTGCSSPEDCNQLFHGFVISLKPESTTVKFETAMLENYMSIYEARYLNDKKMDSMITEKKLTFIKKCDTILQVKKIENNRLSSIKGFNDDNKRKLAKTLSKKNKEVKGYQMDLIINQAGQLVAENPESISKEETKALKILNKELRIIPARYLGKKIETKVNLKLTMMEDNVKLEVIQIPILPDNKPFDLDKFLYVRTTSTKCEYIDTSSIKSTNIYANLSDDVVLRAFERNKQWKNCLIATDVTGSMYPYLAQFKLWHKLHLNAKQSNFDFVFFNDGDNSADFLKKTGEVGGIYYVNTKDFESLSNTLNTAMTSGGGGDAPENNIEAVIKGIEKNPKVKEVIMIADNNATPRDLSLLSKVKVPIRLILCGASNGINLAYLEMVRKNKGSIHTMENDLLDLCLKTEGEKFELDGITYQIKYGNIVKLN